MPTLQRTDRDLGELIGDITRNLAGLVRSEINLVKVSAIEWVSDVTRGAILVAVGGLLGLLTVGLVLTGLVARLGETMKIWEAALLVAAGSGILAILVIAIGLKAVRGPASRSATDILQGRLTDGTD